MEIENNGKKFQKTINGGRTDLLKKLVGRLREKWEEMVAIFIGRFEEIKKEAQQVGALFWIGQSWKQRKR